MKVSLRIASLAPAGTEMVYLLNAEQFLCGISHHCDFPIEALAKPRLTRTFLDNSLPSETIDAQVHQRLRAGLPLYEIEQEVLQAIAPTLVLAQSQCSVCAVDAQQAANLGLYGAEIFSLGANRLDEMIEECSRLAERLTSLGAAIDPLAIPQLLARCERVRRAEDAVRPRVLVIEWISPLIVAGNWTPDLVERAGGASLLASPGEPSPSIEWDDVRQIDPEVLVIAPCGFDLARSLVEVESMRALPGWNELQAVKQDRVFVSNGNGMFHRCGPRLVETLEFLAAALSGNDAKLATFTGAAQRWPQG